MIKRRKRRRLSGLAAPQAAQIRVRRARGPSPKDFCRNSSERISGLWPAQSLMEPRISCRPWLEKLRDPHNNMCGRD